MATAAHCAYCFENLSASFEKRKPLSLAMIDELWATYEAGSDQDTTMDDDHQPLKAVADGSTTSGASRLPAINRLLSPNDSSTSSSSAPSASSSTPSLHTNASSNTSVASRSSGRAGFLGLAGRLTRNKRRSLSQTDEYPLFVTWDTRSRSGSKSLRGCIGTFEAHDLDDGLRSYALTSAFEDTRFMPISFRELSSLECSVTLLTDFEPAADPMDWEVGKHGLRISFSSNGRRYGSTYLPDVAREQGWSKEETVVSLMRKAGWGGHRSDWKRLGLNVVRYQGRRVSLSYRQWRDWRDWVEETSRDPSVLV